MGWKINSLPSKWGFIGAQTCPILTSFLELWRNHMSHNAETFTVWSFKKSVIISDVGTCRKQHIADRNQIKMQKLYMCTFLKHLPGHQRTTCVISHSQSVLVWQVSISFHHFLVSLNCNLSMTFTSKHQAFFKAKCQHCRV
jgi:hypothetical protein